MRVDEINHQYQWKLMDAPAKGVYKKFWKTHKVSTMELVGFDTSVAQFILPRLILFRKITRSTPMNMSLKEWRGTLKKIIIAFDIVAKTSVWSDKQKTAVHLGLGLFHKHFFELWI